MSHPGRYADIVSGRRAKEVNTGRGERRRRCILCVNQEEAGRERRHRDELLTQLEAEQEAVGGLTLYSRVTTRVRRGILPYRGCPTPASMTEAELEQPKATRLQQLTL